MQEFLDEQEIQVKKLAKYDIAKEEEFKRLTTYDFLFHLSVIREED
jgi:hypothetical protein